MANPTVKEFTNDKFIEMTYGDTGEYVIAIRDLLSKSGIDVYAKYPTDTPHNFDEGLEQAVMEFKATQGISNPTSSIINDETLNALLNVSNNMSDIVYADGAESTSIDTTTTGDPHYDSFFSNNNLKETRKNQTDIKITVGNSTITKTIHNVYMRSVSTEFDTSGNPISEVYEFIAQDLTESDEYADQEKYQ